jgi:hypothetical protein
MSIAKKSMIAVAAALMSAALSTPSFSVPVEVAKPVRHDTAICIPMGEFGIFCFPEGHAPF